MKTRFLLFALFITCLSFSQVGIGTTLPTRFLDIAGDLRVRSVTQDDTLEKILVIDDDGNVFYRDVETIMDPNQRKKPHIMKQKWISVKEKKPEIKIDKEKELNQSEPVIGMLSNGEIYKVILTHWFEAPETETYFIFTDDGELAEDITHWIPIPSK